MGYQIIALENKSDRMVTVRVPIPILKILGGFAVYNKVALGILVQTAYDIEHSGLSAARRAENGHKLTLAELQAYSL